MHSQDSKLDLPPFDSEAGNIRLIADLRARNEQLERHATVFALMVDQFQEVRHIPFEELYDKIVEKSPNDGPEAVKWWIHHKKFNARVQMQAVQSEYLKKKGKMLLASMTEEELKSLESLGVDIRAALKGKK